MVVAGRAFSRALQGVGGGEADMQLGEDDFDLSIAFYQTQKSGLQGNAQNACRMRQGRATGQTCTRARTTSIFPWSGLSDASLNPEWMVAG